MSELPEYISDRIFDAPRELVWRAWTDPELLHRWYGPGIETIIHKFDLKPGGSWLNEMKWGGNSDFSKMVFQEATQLQRLVWHHSSSDSDWNIKADPLGPPDVAWVYPLNFMPKQHSKSRLGWFQHFLASLSELLE